MLSEYKYKYEELVTINTNESRIRELSKSGFVDFLNTWFSEFSKYGLTSILENYIVGNL